MPATHDHHHDHEHSSHTHSEHGQHDHHHEPIDYGRSFLIAIVLNIAFVLTEFTYGLIANSTALMADAGHNLSDVLGLVMAWGATLLARRVPNERFTYGLRSSSILAALANAVLLLVACGGIAWEAVHRFMNPPPVVGSTVMWVAAVGIMINGISAWLFMRGSKDDLNIRGAYLHMLADAAVSFGVVLSGLVILLTGWYWLDPLMSLIIVAVIVVGTWNLLRESTQLALLAVPKSVDLLKVAQFLQQQPGVSAIHDLHVWGMSTTEAALTVHLVMPTGYPGDAFMDELTHALKTKFSIAHSTLQIEQGTTEHNCCLHEQIKFEPLHTH
ncbi:cation diffusion facilitator family transporter [uncultured Thiothrix sp.]|uniref:cation diffusion facilitator family transporter n=1 Tax=uncultured Thiothrix sp. TaxID=223185 RepID=UPI00262FD709|nr:cation diffusion facilitator family transporter [uncultured Thiothrix sp.]